MRLQLALDFTTIEDSIKILEEVKDLIDIVEIGTPFLLQDGLKAVRRLKEAFPDLTVLADLKLMDAGAQEAEMAFDAGADLITVLGVSDDSTIRGTVDVAERYDKEVLVDMINVKDIKQRAIELDQLGVDYLCVHTAFDLQSTGKNPLEELRTVSELVNKSKIAVAGGVKMETLQQIVTMNPDLIIVGGSITGKKNKREAAAEMKAVIENRVQGV